MIDLKDKKVLIAGLGLTGKAVLESVSKKGADVAVYDKSDIEWNDPRLYKKLDITEIPAFLNGTDVPDEMWDVIIMSPGISLESEFVLNAQKHNTKIIGELELTYEMAEGRFIAITGTNGKTTTTALTGEIFEKSKKKAVVGGNIGTPIISSLEEASADTYFVTEVSSFQLETTDRFKPFISAVLNLTPDHLDRHKTVENYIKIKSKIFENQDANDYLIYNYDDDIVREMVSPAKARKIPFSRFKELETGVFIKNGKIMVRDGMGSTVELIKNNELGIPGSHNLENALAASGIAYFAGVPGPVIANTLKKFNGVPHRLEHVTTRRGINFVNDSKGTNPESSIKAIEAVGKGIFLIAGGYDKGSDYSKLIESFKGRVKHLLLIGETAAIIKKTAEELGFSEITLCENLGEGVRLGYEYADEGDTVLLSPASASWDMYKNFEERGDHFKKIVEELK